MERFYLFLVMLIDEIEVILYYFFFVVVLFEEIVGLFVKWFELWFWYLLILGIWEGYFNL